MILLCGIPTEPPIRLVTEAAEECGCEYVMFNQRMAESTDICLEIISGKVDGILKIGSSKWSLRDFSGVYMRMMDYQDLPENKPSRQGIHNPEQVLHSALLHNVFNNWLEMADCRIMNKSSSMNSNMSKPFQAQFIIKAGFKTPNTLITNTPDEVRKFQKTNKKIIYKSISSERSIVKVLGDVKLNELNTVRHLPTQFQEYIPGENIRVHVAGSEIFATKILSDATDYRYANDEGFETDMVPFELPSEIEKKCKFLSKCLNLPLCGIDLKKKPEGDCYCFEVNPSTAYSY